MKADIGAVKVYILFYEAKKKMLFFRFLRWDVKLNNNHVLRTAGARGVKNYVDDPIKLSTAITTLQQKNNTIIK